MSKTSFTIRKINVQVSWREKSLYVKFHEQNQHTPSFMNKISFTRRKFNVQVSRSEKLRLKKFHEQNQHAISSKNKNEHEISSMNKTNFTRRKFNEQVSRREKSICNMFKKTNQHPTSSLNKISFTRRKINVHREKSKFYEVKNQDATCFKKIIMQPNQPTWDFRQAGLAKRQVTSICPIREASLLPPFYPYHLTKHLENYRFYETILALWLSTLALLP